jgi:hemerythrin-like domain-containing protein
MPLIPPPMAPSIDDPIELLLACHDKVRRFTTLALKLRDHVVTDGADAQAADAAQSILRYFDMAAPLHHDDEDLNLFPALRSLGHPELTARIDALSAEHDTLGMQWLQLHPWLEALTAGVPTPAPTIIDDFVRDYQQHAQHEESDIYPWARQLDTEQIQRISQAMVLRRST